MNRERVQMLRDMMEGVPEENIFLDSVYRGRRPGMDYPDHATCGTIACMFGFARLYPPFIEQGIREHQTFVTAAIQFFDIPHSVFMGIRSYELGPHKQIALRRLDALLK